MSAATVTTADLRLSDSSQISATTNGATLGSATNATLINYVGAGNRLIVTFADYAMVITDHAGNGGHGSLKLITFPVGMIDINGIVGDIAITAGAGFANDAEFDMALGSITTGIDNDILAGAEQDVVDKVDGELDGSFADTIDLVNVTLQQEDGHSGATDVWFNVAVLDTDMSTTGSITMSGTIVITWTNLGDY